MKKITQLFVLFIFVGLGLYGCKSKQQVTTIPGAHAQAGNTTPQAVQTVSPVEQSTVAEQPEEVRDEKFQLDPDEGKTDAINQKYHVVVGSFKNRDNAKGLQTTLNKEGNSAIIVVNEQGMYRVLIASYQTYQEARNKRDQINSRFPDAWVLTQKK